MVRFIIIESNTLDKNDQETLKRISNKHVGYMEISATAKGFACGGCRSLNDKGFCENPDVKAYVSANHGCCNYFYPHENKAQVTFPEEEKGDGSNN